MHGYSHWRSSNGVRRGVLLFKFTYGTHRQKYSTTKLRSVITETILQRNAGEKLSIPGLHKFSDRKSLIVKYLNSLAIITSILLFTYLSYNRFSHYFEYKTAVDVLQSTEEFDHPAIRFIASDTMAMEELSVKSGISTGIGIDLNCINPLLRIVNIENKNPNITLDEIFHATNITSQFLGLKIKSAKNAEFKLLQEEIKSPRGIALGFRFAESWKSSYESSFIDFTFEKNNSDFCAEHTWLISFTEANSKKLQPMVEFPVTVGSQAKLSFSYVKFMFISTPKNPCVSQEENNRCVDLCLRRAFSQLTCRLPFTQYSNELPNCSYDSTISSTLIAYFFLLYSADDISYCKCPKKCQDFTVMPIVESTKSERNLISFRFYFRDREITAYVERLQYDKIALLAEIGGSLGLCLNLSILSCIQCLIFIFKIIQNSFKKRKTKNLKPLIRKVLKVLRRVNEKKNYFTTATISKFIIIIFLSVVTLLALYSRVSYFLSVPVQTTVQVQLLSRVQFPTIIVCGESMKIFKWKKKFNNNKVPGCEKINPLKLVSEKISVEDIWKEMSIDKVLAVSEMVKNFVGFDNTIPSIKSSVLLPFGNCTQIKTEPVPIFKNYPPLLLQMMPFPKFAFCDKHLLTYFLTLRGEPLDLSGINDIQGGRRNTIYIQTKIIYRLNITRDSCVSNEEYFKCKESCYKRKVKNLVTCRLPYMDEKEFNYSMCTTANSAIECQQNFLRIFLQSKPFPDCSCLKRCNESLIITQFVSEEHDFEMVTSLNHIFLTNYFEFIDVISYPIQVLISDTGAILGLGLGLSMLSVFNI